ncbi:MAG: glycosyltransferase family 1 protein [Bacteroidota bacterium]
MAIGIDVRKYYDFGIGTYIQHLIGEYAKMQTSHHFLLFAGPEDAKTVDIPAGWRTFVVPYGKYSFGEIALFGHRINASDVSVFHSPHYTLPFGLKCKSIVTIHDLIHLRFPQYFSLLQRSYSYGMIWHATRDARFIITDTEFTKHDILQSFRVKEEKIIPIPLGVSEQFHSKPTHSQLEDFKLKFKVEYPFILFVGNSKPHKGVSILLHAFKEVLASFPDINLVFVGGPLSSDKTFHELMNNLGISKKVRSLGRISNEDLILAYNSAEMFVLPSLYEGFGLPALEAMASGTPVVVSNAGSLPEIVGNAAIVCESGNHGMFADAMMNLHRNPALKEEMIKKGKERSRSFSWQVTAKKTLEVYDKTF